jgi:hypothetical protein
MYCIINNYPYQKKRLTLSSTISLITFFLILITYKNLYSQPSNISYANYLQAFEQLEAQQTGFLLNYAYLDHQPLEEFYLTASESLMDRNIKTTYGKWQQIYQNLRIAGTAYTFNSEGNIIDEVSPNLLPQMVEILPDQSRNNPIIPIGMIFTDTDYIHADSIESNLNADSTSLLPETPLEIVNVLNISNLRKRVFFQDVLFQIDTALLFTNRDDVIGLEIDFSDGMGLKYFDIKNQTIPVNYSTYGDKTIYYRLITSEGTLLSTSELRVSPILNPDSEESTTINTESGNTASAKFNVYLGCDGILDRPVLIVGGFEVLKRSNPYALYERYYWTGLVNYLQGNGYDIITVGFDDTHISMKENAEVLQSVIEYINAQKVDYFDNIVIGESMGGVISRICLKSMEDQEIDHQMRLYISFDAPHKGANAPLSVQETVHDILNADVSSFFAGIIGYLGGSFLGGIAGGIFGSIVTENLITDLVEEGIVDGVNATLNDGYTLEQLEQAMQAESSREIIIRNKFAESDNDIQYDTINPKYEAFQYFLDSLGFPQQCRNITIINGSNTAQKQIIQRLSDGSETLLMQGDSIINTRRRNVLTYALVSFVDAIDVQVSAISRRKNRFFFNIQEKGFFSFGSRTFDTSPGSYGGVTSLSSPNSNYFISFIPSASGIALNTALFETPNGLLIYNDSSVGEGLTREELIMESLVPFDDIYSQSQNTQHLSYFALGTQVQERLKQREFMLDTFDLQNRIFDQQQIRQINAYELVTIGTNANTWTSTSNPKLHPSGAVQVEDQSTLRIHSEYGIQFKTGFSVEEGSELEANIVPSVSGCPQLRHYTVSNPSINIIPRPDIQALIVGGNLSTFVDNLYYKADKDDYYWTVIGLNYTQFGYGNTFSVRDLSPGFYTVSCSLFNGIQSNSIVVYVPNDLNDEKDVLSTSELLTINANRFYPNPTNSLIQWTDGQAYQVLVYDIDGRLVQNREKARSLDISNLPSGRYIIILKQRNKGIVARELIIKQ